MRHVRSQGFEPYPKSKNVSIFFGIYVSIYVSIFSVFAMPPQCIWLFWFSVDLIAPPRASIRNLLSRSRPALDILFTEKSDTSHVYLWMLWAMLTSAYAVANSPSLWSHNIFSFPAFHSGKPVFFIRKAESFFSVFAVGFSQFFWQYLR